MAKKDINQLAKFIIDIATGSVSDPNEDKKPGATVKGRAGGKIGGMRKAATLTAKQRKELAKMAAAKRWQSGS
ncbi:hypothetical protein [Mucilaginibacter sp.]|uniref:hypothetical protein n=1 Tax=Mucilaginibacter sp. TaxID=1882438 RepID=UPI0035BC6D77